MLYDDPDYITNLELRANGRAHRAASDASESVLYLARTDRSTDSLAETAKVLFAGVGVALRPRLLHRPSTVDSAS